MTMSPSWWRTSMRSPRSERASPHPLRLLSSSSSSSTGSSCSSMGSPWCHPAAAAAGRLHEGGTCLGRCGAVVCVWRLHRAQRLHEEAAAGRACRACCLALCRVMHVTGRPLCTCLLVMLVTQKTGLAGKAECSVGASQHHTYHTMLHGDA